MLLLAGPQRYGKRGLLSAAIQGLDPAVGERWEVTRCDLEKLGALVGGRELTLEAAFDAMLRQLLVPALDDPAMFDQCVGKKAIEPQSVLQGVLRIASRPVIALLEGVDTVDRRFFEPVLSTVKAWLPLLDGRTAPWNRIRIVLLSNLDALATFDLHRDIASYAYGFSNSPTDFWKRFTTVEVGELDADEVRAVAESSGVRWTEAEVRAVMERVGGHPWLVELMAREAGRGLATAELARRAASPGGPLAPFFEVLKPALSRVVGFRAGETTYPAIAPETVETLVHGDPESLNELSKRVLRFYASWGLVKAHGEVGFRGRVEWRRREPAPRAGFEWLERR